MLTKRLLACFDMRDGMVTKAHKFQDNFDIGTAEEIARRIYEDQIDEILFYDITASAEKKPLIWKLCEWWQKMCLFLFLSAGGIRNLDDMYQVLKAGAEKLVLILWLCGILISLTKEQRPWHSVHHLKYAGKASGKNEKYSFRL